MKYFGFLNKISIIAMFTLCISCKKSEEALTKPTVNRTVLIYIAANNNLRDDALVSLNKIEKGARDLNGNIIVYIKTKSGEATLLKIRHDESEKIVSDTIKVYGQENSSDPDFLNQVIRDSRALSPAKSYGLVMWSHATSWSPPTFKTKSIGNDNNYEMDIKDFKNAIPSDFEYIMFDACSMGSLEVVNELRDKARYLLTSPSEVLSTSFPYDVITPFLFGDVNELVQVCNQFLSFYDTQTGAHASATVSLVKTDELALLVRYTKELLGSKRPENLAKLDIVQRLDFENSSRVAAYDFISFLRNNYDPQLYLRIENQLKRAIVFKGHTANFLNIPIREFCGLTVYLPTKQNNFAEYYKTLNWYTESGWNNLF